MSSIPNGQKDGWSSASQELFRAARSDHAPTSADRERVRRALAERIAVGPSASSARSLAGHAGSALSRVLKVGFGVSLVVAATIAVKRAEEPARVVQPAAVAAPSGALGQQEGSVEAAAEMRVAEQERSDPAARGGAVLTREPASETREAAPSARSARRAHGRAGSAPAGIKLQPTAAVADESQSARASTVAAATPQASQFETGSRLARAETGHAALARAEQTQPVLARDSEQGATAPQQAERVQNQADNQTAERSGHAHSQAQIGRAAAEEEHLEPRAPEARVSKADERAEAARAELAFVRKMQAALRAGEADEVLELSLEHAERWPHGTFVQEREGLRAIASCNIAEQSAAARAKAFLAKYPRTPLGPRVREACKLQSRPAVESGGSRNAER